VVDESPLVSCLCVTENRPAFMPWLLWSFDRQTWPAKELVIIDSSARTCSVPERNDVRVISAPPGSRVAHKRNQALAAANGSVVAWFDDDDWQHPQRLEASITALRGGAPCTGPRGSWVFDLANHNVWRFGGFEELILFNGAAFLTEIARSATFDPTYRRASDTVWLSALRTSRALDGWRPLDLTSFFWLTHGGNLSVSSSRTSIRAALSRASRADIVQALGVAWADTDDHLAALGARLGIGDTTWPRRNR
jgi:hypothetical protein